MKIKLDKTMEEFLQEFALTQREIDIYLTLLKTGPNTIMNLARETGIKRSTTHNNVEELIEKGLVSQTNYGERRMVIAEDPGKLKFLLEQKKFRVNKLEQNLPHIIEQISKLVPTTDQKTEVEVKYYVGKDEIQYVYSQILKSKEIYSYVNVDKVKEIFPENIDIFSNKVIADKDIKMWEILERHSRKSDKEDETTSSNYKYKYVPLGVSLHETDIMVFDSSIALVNLEIEKPSAILIKSKSLSESLRNIHKMVWELLK